MKPTPFASLLPGLFACALLLFPMGGPARAEAIAAQACRLDSARVWLREWLGAWELTSREILKLESAPAPEMVFFDTTCVYTTSPITGRGAGIEEGPALHGVALPWRARAHGGAITLPDSGEVPPQLMSFANLAKTSGPYFVMSAPAIWRARLGPGAPHGVTAVFLHEFAHTMQVRGMARIIGPIDATWPYPEELDDDAVQTHFESDSEYVAAYLAERDTLYRAAGAATDDEARALAARALEMMRARHAHWFTGDRAVFATLDDIWLSMEGAGQFAGCAWLAHPQGGGMTREDAIAKMIGRRRRWSQDQGLALMLVLERLLPGWPKFVFADPSAGALELLERAAGESHGDLLEERGAGREQ